MPVRPLPPNASPPVERRPEVLAPAGDLRSLRAGLAAGADAVYFGIDEGFNARARAANFSVDNLAQVVAEVHRAGARAYVTLNTLVFESELAALEELLPLIAASGVDAVIVQDPAVCLIARAICPALEIHASTQMTISSAEGVRFAQSLGATRVVVPRELSVSEIAALREGTEVELEVFIHGALCVSWSGQCLSSEAWGGRSANRGQCAQACRLPYQLIVDGALRPLGEVEYLLSPKDLAGERAIPALMQIGVHTLKIEGRLKGPTYVDTAVRGVQAVVEAVQLGKGSARATREQLARDLAEMSVTYSRGFSDGFLAGSDHQTLVEGRFPKHRGAYLGRVVSVDGLTVLVAPEERPIPDAVGELASPLPDFGGSPIAASGPGVAAVEPQAGMGVGFDLGRPEEREPGGMIWAVERQGSRWLLRFGAPGPDLAAVEPGHRVWITSDPERQRAAERSADGAEPVGRLALTMQVRGRAGEAMEVLAEARRPLDGTRLSTARVVSESFLTPASGRGLEDALLEDKLGSLGGTPFHLAAMDTQALEEGLHLPVRELKVLRRELVEQLLPAIENPPRQLRVEVLDRRSLAPVPEPRPAAPQLVPLCRTDAQLDAVMELGFEEVELDWMELVGLGKAVERTRAAGLRVGIATIRVQKPGEEGFDKRIARLQPDSVLVRHWGALMHFAEHPNETRPVLHGDFSLNVTNALTAAHLLSLGLDTVTAAHDLDAIQLGALLDAMPPSRASVTIHHHIPTFHTEHCVYAHTLSQGRDYRSCGRPCESHEVSLQDRKGLEHPVVVDVGCRNTVFNAQAQTAASLVPDLVTRGVGRLRLEFVRETREETRRVLQSYRKLLAGELSPAECLATIGIHEQFGVSAGTMRTLKPRIGSLPERHQP